MRALILFAVTAFVSACGTQTTAGQLNDGPKKDACFKKTSKVTATKNYTVLIGKIQKADVCIWGKEAPTQGSADLAELGISSYPWTPIAMMRDAPNPQANQNFLQLSAKDKSIMLDVPLIDEEILFPIHIKQKYPSCFAKNDMPDFAIIFPETSLLGIRYRDGWETKRCGD
jgi:hypothetical protein